MPKQRNRVLQSHRTNGRCPRCKEDKYCIWSRDKDLDKRDPMRICKGCYDYRSKYKHHRHKLDGLQDSTFPPSLPQISEFLMPPPHCTHFLVVPAYAHVPQFIVQCLINNEAKFVMPSAELPSDGAEPKWCDQCKLWRPVHTEFLWDPADFSRQICRACHRRWGDNGGKHVAPDRGLYRSVAKEPPIEAPQDGCAQCRREELADEMTWHRKPMTENVIVCSECYSLHQSRWTAEGIAALAQESASESDDDDY